MKAVVTTGERRKVSIEEIPIPLVQPGMLLLKTRCCSICGSDLAYLDGTTESLAKEGGKPPAGVILGHEFCAEVVEIGEGVEGWSVGDRATVTGIRRGCGQCYFCQRNLPHLCTGAARKRVTSLSELRRGGYRSGVEGMAEYFVMAAASLIKVPDSVSDEEAALVEPFSISLGTAESSGLKPGDTAVIIGAGKIGLGAMLCAKAAGASPVIIVDLVKSRLDKALKMGADAALDANEDDVVPEVTKLTEVGPDAVIICSRNGKVLNQAADMVRRGGIIVIVGFVPPTEINPQTWLAKNLTVRATNRLSPIAASMRLIESKQVDVKQLITEVIPLEEAQRAFDSMYSGENIVALLKP